MKVEVRIEGSLGNESFKPGDVLTLDHEEIRKMLVHQLALPLDDQAVAFMANTDQHSRYFSESMQMIYNELFGGDDNGSD